jgi:hypothetical protein
VSHCRSMADVADVGDNARARGLCADDALTCTMLACVEAFLHDRGQPDAAEVLADERRAFSLRAHPLGAL